MPKRTALTQMGKKSEQVSKEFLGLSEFSARSCTATGRGGEGGGTSKSLPRVKGVTSSNLLTT